jgi:glucose/arabinose dehydrogenase
MLKKIFLTLICSTLILSCSHHDDLPLNQLILPEGYKIEVYADNVPGARTLDISDNGIIFVGTRGQGKVYALIPPKQAQDKIQTITLLSELNEPNSVVYYKGDLYVAELNRITQYKEVDKHLDNMPEPIVLNDSLPTEKWHGYRVMKIGPDNHIYVSIGMPCNSCSRDKGPLFGTITRMTLEGKDLKPYAIGVRNSVGFDWHPDTHALWFTDNGRDNLGDDIPPDEINRADKPGLDFGFPYVYGDNILAPDFTENDIKGLTFIKPVFQLPAHVAPLGMLFLESNIALVAEHGSWNRSKKDGYQIIQVTLDGNRITEAKPYISGWLQGEKAWGRPVDFLSLDDGSLLITDDQNGVIYRMYR